MESDFDNSKVTVLGKKLYGYMKHKKSKPLIYSDWVRLGPVQSCMDEYVAEEEIERLE